MTRNDDLSPLATLRSECLHLAVRMLAYGDAEAIDPADAIRVAEEYLVWVLAAGRDGTTVDPRHDRAPRPMGDDTSEASEGHSTH